MEQVIKTFTGLFLLLVLTFVGVGLIQTSLTAKNADTYLDTIANQWAASNFTMTEEELYAALSVDPKEYRISLTAYEAEASLHTGYASAALTYRLRIPVIGLDTERTITKSLR